MDYKNTLHLFLSIPGTGLNQRRGKHRFNVKLKKIVFVRLTTMKVGLGPVTKNTAVFT